MTMICSSMTVMSSAGKCKLGFATCVEDKITSHWTPSTQMLEEILDEGLYVYMCSSVPCDILPMTDKQNLHLVK